METKYLVTKDIIHNIEGFNTTITAYFKQEMFLYSHSCDRYYMYNLLTIKGYKFLFKGRGRDCNQKFLWWPFYNWRLPKNDFLENWAWSPAWMYLAKHQYK